MENRYSFGPFTLDLQRSAILENGRPVRWWSHRRFDLLKMLLEAEGEVVSYSLLVDRVWQSKDVLIHTVIQTANDLRRCLGVYGKFIENHHGIGYSFRRANAKASSDACRQLDLMALTLYTLATEEFQRRTRSALCKALNYFRAVADEYHTFAPAVLGIADCLVLLGHGGFPAFAPKAVIPEARAAAERALALATDVETQAAAKATLGKLQLMFDWNWKAAEGSFQEALSLCGCSSSAYHGLAHVYLITGKWDEALSAISEARRLAPSSPMIQGTAGWMLHFMGRNLEAIELCRQTTDLHPQFAAGFVMSAMAQQAVGNHEQAADAFARSYELEPAPAPLAGLANLHASCGRIGKAHWSMRKLQSLGGRMNCVVSPYFVALGHAGLGDHSRARQCLQQAYRDRFDWMAQLGLDPRWRVFHRHRWFKSLLEEMRLAPR